MLEGTPYHISPTLILSGTRQHLSTHGGLVVYIKNVLFDHIQDIRFSKCTVSFKSDFIPDYFFMGVYMYPYGSHNFSERDFGIFSQDIEYWLSRGVTPFIGGDLNSRNGDLNALPEKSLGWRYEENVDTHTLINTINC